MLAGTGTSGAYHAGVLKALDESGVKIDLLVGSGAGAIAAAFGAVSAGAQVYGPAGFWAGVRWRSFYRLRPALAGIAALFAVAGVVFFLPLGAGLAFGLLFPLVLVLDRLWPGLASRFLAPLREAPEALGGPYLAVLALPVAVLSILALVLLARFGRDRRRLLEAFESHLVSRGAEARLRRHLWAAVRGAAPSPMPASDADLGRSYVALASENIGEPGFRELILRVLDLETGQVLPLLLLGDERRAAFAAARPRGRHPRSLPSPGAADLRAPGGEGLLFDAVLTGLLPPLAAPVRRVTFPKHGMFSGETHRLTDATLAGGTGIGEALAAGAEQIVLVTACPEAPGPPRRRRGRRALHDAFLLALERQAVECDLRQAERINRMVGTLGHETEDGERAWEDPAAGRLYRAFALYVVRPEKRWLGPLDLDGAMDPETEVVLTTSDLLEKGHRDAYRLFVEPIVGAAPAPPAEAPVVVRQAVEL